MRKRKSASLTSASLRSNWVLQTSVGVRGHKMPYLVAVVVVVVAVAVAVVVVVLHAVIYLVAR